MKIITFTTILSLFLLSCGSNENAKTQEQPTKDFQNKGHEIVHNMVQKVGNYNTLHKKKDVVYTYTYQTPDGKKDISTEKYMFNGELSSGTYHTHERTLPELEGEIEQGYDGKEFWLKHNDTIVTDDKLMPKVKFNRPTNFYWFAMMPKLLDDGLKYEYIGEQTINSNTYDIVKVSFETKNDKPTDIYQLFINKKTLLVDQFLFTVADFGVIETPFLMVLEYETIDGLLIPTHRKYKKSTWKADVSNDPWINVTWTDIKFNTGLTKEDFKK
ncbi:DUF6503 family protein [Psychroserpens damuponensis]|uniref:DUF6503 family protein n=1 Tax=Psychroserpens damuponensis TaxID=943936 RepID=UPI00058C19CC|nr:DUF6503 family protein [Psychroserpens damuponensis]